MAFSTFRGMMAATSSGTPPVYNDVFGTEVPCIISSGTSGAGSSLTCLVPGSGNTYYAVGTVGSTRYATVITRDTSYVYNNNQLTLAATGTNNHVDGSSVDATHFLVAYDNGGSAINAQYITNTAGTLSATVGSTTVVTGGGALSSALTCVLDSSNALVWGFSAGSPSNNRMSLINPTTLSVTQNSTSTSSITAGQNMSLVAISPTLAVVSWNKTTGNHLWISTIDITSGTSFVINAAFDTGIVNASGGYPQMYPINSTTALMVYFKSANTIAARTVTLGVGGSVTLNTEYTTSAPNLLLNFSPFRIAAYGSKYMVGYGELGSGAGKILATGISVTGNVITWDTAGFSVISSASNYNVNNNFWCGQFVPVDSTHVAVMYPVADTGGRVGVTSVIDVSPTTQTWGTFNAHNSNSYTDASTAGTYTRSTSALWIGTNRILASGYGSGGNLSYYFFDSAAGQSGYGIFNTANVVDSTILSGVAAMCNLGYDDVNLQSRVLTVYASAANTISAAVITNQGGSSLTLGTPTTFATGGSSGINTALNGTYSVIPLTSDTGLFIGFDLTSASNSYKANIITVTTGGTTISATSTYSNVIQITGDQVQSGIAFLQYSVIDSTHVAVLFETKTIATGKYNLKMCILSISGTTITAGAFTSVYSGYTNASNGFGIATLGNGTGIVYYTNDVVAPGTTLFANGFTYSGTTITLGTQSSVATSQSMQQLAYGRPSCTMVSSTEAMMGNVKYSTSFGTVRLLTYVNINSITGGSLVTSSLTTNNQFGIIPTDLPNNTFMIFGDTNYLQYYRG